MRELGLEESEIDKIRKIFEDNEKVECAAVFGSRAKGTHRKYSDIDIALWGDLDLFDAQHIESELEELPLIYKFDVTAYAELKNAELREHIDRVGVVIYRKQTN